MLQVTGTIFQVNLVTDKVAQIVLKKNQRGKAILQSFDVYGFWKEKALKDQKLKKGDKIRAQIYMEARLWKGKYYNSVFFRDIELLPKKEKKKKQASEDYQHSLIPDSYIVDETTGEILL